VTLFPENPVPSSDACRQSSCHHFFEASEFIHCLAEQDFSSIQIDLCQKKEKKKEEERNEERKKDVKFRGREYSQVSVDL